MRPASADPVQRSAGPVASPRRVQSKRGIDACGKGEVEPVEDLRGGVALSTTVRADMEERFGHDFSRVRVHADRSAAISAKAFAAKAYAFGHDVVFGSGRYEPSTDRGRELLAHELAHVVQQTSRTGSPAAAGAAEAEAESAAAAIAGGAPAKVEMGTPASIQRDPEGSDPAPPQPGIELRPRFDPAKAARSAARMVADYNGRLIDDGGALVEIFNRSGNLYDSQKRRSAAGELGALTDYLDHGSPDGRVVASIRLMPSRKGGVSADAHIKFVGGTEAQLEIRTITSAPGIRSNSPATTVAPKKFPDGKTSQGGLVEATREREATSTDLKAAIRQKAVTAAQLSASQREPLPGGQTRTVAPGGDVVIDIPFGTKVDAPMIDEAMRGQKINPNVRGILFRFRVASLAGTAVERRFYSRGADGEFAGHRWEVGMAPSAPAANASPGLRIATGSTPATAVGTAPGAAQRGPRIEVEPAPADRLRIVDGRAVKVAEIKAAAEAGQLHDEAAAATPLKRRMSAPIPAVSAPAVKPSPPPRSPRAASAAASQEQRPAGVVTTPTRPVEVPSPSATPGTRVEPPARQVPATTPFGKPEVATPVSPVAPPAGFRLPNGGSREQPSTRTGQSGTHVTVPSRPMSTPVGPSQRGEAIGGGILLLLDGVHALLNHFANKQQREAAQAAWDTELPKIQEEIARTGRGVVVYFEYTTYGESQILVFGGIHWTSGGNDPGQPGSLRGPGQHATFSRTYVGPTQAEASITDETALEFRYGQLRATQKLYQQQAERKSQETWVGRWLRERQQSHIDPKRAYDAKAHITSAREAMKQKRFADAAHSLDLAEADLDEMLRQLQAYMGPEK